MMYEIEESIICCSACHVHPKLWAHACFGTLLHAPLMQTLHVVKSSACMWLLLHKI